MIASSVICSGFFYRAKQTISAENDANFRNFIGCFDDAEDDDDGDGGDDDDDDGDGLASSIGRIFSLLS
jgi:hypothetical protein